MGRLSNKVAVITGASSGIGKAISELFASEDATVVVADVDDRNGSAIANAIAAGGGKAIFIHTDVTSTESVQSCVQEVVRRFGAVHILCNNAGGSRPTVDTLLTDTSDEEFWATITLNLFGTWLCGKFFIPEMVKAGGGSVINMASMVAIRPFAGIHAYTAAKGGVISLTRAMALAYAAQKIRVNAIAPGAVGTERVLSSMRANPSARTSQPLGLVEPGEIAQAALYLASDEAPRTTGQILAVDGGTNL